MYSELSLCFCEMTAYIVFIFYAVFDNETEKNAKILKLIFIFNSYLRTIDERNQKFPFHK